MKLWQRILCASVLDLLIGDPLSMPHPVRLMGKLAATVEAPCRYVKNEKTAGILAAATVVSTSTLTAVGLERGARLIHPRLGDLMSIGLLYTCLAPRDLGDHAERVRLSLVRGDLPAAREAVGRIVGRDTAVLDTDGVVRAAVESVAENTTDGVISPLFYAFLGGAPAAVAFKAASTLDSTFGYRTERYLRFGWASARFDDLANYVPARLAVPFAACAAGILGHSVRGVIRTVHRDARKHASPNSGIAEAAVAGALGIQLGGPVRRGGQVVNAPFFGEPTRPLQIEDIHRAEELMWVTFALVGVFMALLRGGLGRKTVCPFDDQTA